MTPKDGFDTALERAKHLLRLYRLICDTRQRNVRSDWAASFKSLMRWPANETIVRVDGDEQQSMLVFRESCGIERSHFAHDYLSELLRAAVVAVVSALDRYMHDLVVKHSWKLLTRKEEEIPRGLRNFSVSALDTRRALQRLRKDATSRPGTLVKAAIQERLHREHTFQSPNDILHAGKEMLGIGDFWGKVSKKMPGTPSKEDVIQQLREINRRRNQIVHEADLVRTQRAEADLRDIDLATAESWVNWMDGFGAAIQAVVDDTL